MALNSRQRLIRHKTQQTNQPTELFSIEQIIYIKTDWALNNLQRLICHKTHQTKPLNHYQLF